MQFHRKITLFVLTGFLLAGCSRGSPHPDLPPGGVPDPNADTFIFYSIDGRERPSEDDVRSKDRLHGYPILGMVEVTDLAVRKQLVEAFKSGAPGNLDRVAACFWPRHAISTTSGKRKIDYLVCFQCTKYQVFDGTEPVTHNITKAPQANFNRVLKDAGIPVAP